MNKLLCIYMLQKMLIGWETLVGVDKGDNVAEALKFAINELKKKNK